MKKVMIIALIIVGMLLVPAASAETLIDEHINYYEFTGGQSTNPSTGYGEKGSYNFNSLYINNIQNLNDISYIVIESPYMGYNQANYKDWCALPDGRHEMAYNIGEDVSGTGTIVVSRSRDFLGQISNTRVTFFFDSFNIGTLTGNKVLTFSPTIANLKTYGTDKPETTLVGDSPIRINCVRLLDSPYKITVSGGRYILNDIYVESLSEYDIKMKITRVFGPDSYASNIKVFNGSDVLKYEDESANNVEEVFLKSDFSKLIVSTSYKSWEFDLSDTGDPDESNVIVYVKNSQTGALIADANIVIDALVNGEYYPVANRTEPSGIFSITLQPTGGGQPNPDGYRLIATADGYNNPMPEINFTVDDYKISIYCLLDPIAGGPVNENKTFIDFFVRDMSSNPISGATVKFGKYTLITNSAGYTVFEVDKNNNYSWTVSKSGYGSLTGNAVIGADPRHTINTVLAPAVTPIKPTPIPTSPPIGPTPTMTAPTGEPVSNWLEWFAAHFGMILGGGAEIGKIFMWLCFTVPVGVYVGKEAKAGAAGFMAGAGIVTLFFVLIGWVPIWLVVLLALIIGLLYAREFNTPDNGGGR